MGELFDFNIYTYQEMDITIDPADYVFENEPTGMSGVFHFTVKRTFLSSKTQQIVTMNSGNIIYTREYDGVSEIFSDWITTSGSSGGGIASITSTNNSLKITNPSGPTVNIEENNVPVTVNATGNLTATANFIKVGTTGTIQTLPLGSTVTPLRTYTVKNLNIATTAVGPQGSDQLDGSTSAINIVGPFNSMDFKWDNIDNMWYSC